MTVTGAFSQSYAQARVKFLEGAAIAGLPTQSFNHPLTGAQDETLAMDVALDGAPDASSVLLVSSACHGVEGFCGSGVQVFALHDQDWRERARAAGVAVLYIHALNPFGFSHLRRATHENVDLNRNFQDFGQSLPRNTAYDELQALALPASWPPGAANDAAIARWVSIHGPAALQAAISGGQYHHPLGLFYGGHAPTWSNLTLRSVLRHYGRQARRLAWIDLHTGLGPRGVGERIFACKNDAPTLQRARRWWGDAVTSTYDGSSVSSALSGMMWMAVYEECPQAQYTGIALEYGTLPMDEVMLALRAEQWLYQHPEAPAAQAAQIKRDLRNSFYVDADDWKGMVVAQAREAMVQAVEGLRGPNTGPAVSTPRFT